MSQYILNTKARTEKGRSASRRLRRANSIPAILYGKHSKPESLVIDTPEFTRLLKTVGGRAVLIELACEGRKDKALTFLQEIQRDPMTDRFLHIDFHEVKAGEKIEITVPVRTTGEALGVRSQNGVLEIITHALHIRCLPKDLPETIVIDVTALEIGEVLKISDIEAIPGVEIQDQPGQPVISCVEPVKEIEEEVASVTAEAVEGDEAPADGDATAAPAADAPADSAAPPKK